MVIPATDVFIFTEDVAFPSPNSRNIFQNILPADIQADGRMIGFLRFLKMTKGKN